MRLPAVPRAFADDARRQAVLDELVESDAELVVLLGDEPVKHWLRALDARWNRLADFGDGEAYGQKHAVPIKGRTYQVLPLAHPRQVAGLGSHSAKWRSAHQTWVANQGRRHSAAGGSRSG